MIEHGQPDSCQVPPDSLPGGPWVPPGKCLSDFAVLELESAPLRRIRALLFTDKPRRLMPHLRHSSVDGNHEPVVGGRDQPLMKCAVAVLPLPPHARGIAGLHALA